MPLFNRKNKKPLNESNSLAQNYEINGIEAYNFIKGLRLIASDTYNTDYILDRMMDDAIISAAVDMYIDDALQVDPQKQEIFWVDVDTTDDSLEEGLAKGLTDELNRFLKSDLRMNKTLREILRRVIIYGECPVRLDFIDKLEDDRLALIDKNKPTFESIAKPIFDNLLVEKSSEDITKEISDLNESGFSTLNLDNMTNLETRKRVLRYLNESCNTGKRKLTESQLLNEDILNNKNEDIKRLIRGRWFAECISSGTNLWELASKGKIIAYMDVRKPNLFVNPTNIVNFSNNTGKYHINFEVGPYNESITDKDYFVLQRGQSYLDNSIVAWQILAALEDILMLTRMTRSTLYRIFSVEVGNKGDTETKKILTDLKNKIKSDETINVKDKIYNSEMRQIPLGDSIFIPTRNGIGNIDIKVVGGDVNLKDAIDLDYFKDKLFASLRIPKAFLGFSEDSGGLINTSLTRMDIRYARTIKGIQNIAADGLKDLCLKYLEFTRTEKVLRELPDFKIVFTSINTEEDNQRCETKQVQIETLGKTLEAFENLGIDVANTTELRDALIKEWLGSDYLDIINNAKQDGNLATTDGESAGGLSGGPNLGGSGPDIGSNFDMGGPDLDNLESDVEEPGLDNTEEIGANDTDFEASGTTEPPSGLSREL